MLETPSRVCSALATSINRYSTVIKSCIGLPLLSMLAARRLASFTWAPSACRSYLGARSRKALSLPRAAVHARVLASMTGADFQDYKFGPWTIHSSEVFVTSPLSYGFVNLKPVVPGHVLVSPKRVVARFAELRPEEVADLWCLSQRVGVALQPHHSADSLTLTIQDGPSSGQTVPHVHVHILPRKPGDFEQNDQVYDAIDEASKALPRGGDHLDLDKERKPRTPEEMAAEAAELRKLFQ